MKDERNRMTALATVVLDLRDLNRFPSKTIWPSGNSCIEKHYLTTIGFHIDQFSSLKKKKTHRNQKHIETIKKRKKNTKIKKPLDGRRRDTQVK